MGIGAALVLMAIGAALAWALDIDPTPVAGISVNWEVVGFILLVVGAVGLVWSLILLNSGRTHVVEDRRRASLD